MPSRNRLACIALLTVLLAAGIAAAQVSGEEWTEFEKLRNEIKADRQSVVAENMKLGETEAQAFWALYREYHLEIDKLGDRAAKLIAEYATKYEQITDVDADKFLKEWLAIDQEKGKLRQSYVKKFTKVVGPKQTARYFQIENKLDAVVNLGLAADIPLVP
jgi:hypothetical protein